ncbi:MAG: hypothetical protein M3276_11110, partial [Actinomycetota bacterium]|nr:hypothetical protein [Actinomycetota bacterium]
MLGPSPAREPWRDTPVGELHDPLLPRWFVLTALAMIPLAVAALVGAFALLGTREVPVAERRPPPQGPFTNAVGAHQIGGAEPVVYEDACRLLRGVRVAGTAADRSLLRRGLAGLCNTALADALSEPTEAALDWFAAHRGTVRFAAFEATGVDSTATAFTLEGPPGPVDVEGPLILVNAKFARADPLWIAPLVAHDAVLLHQDRANGRAEAALAARRAEAEVC